jgi:hypothetical protein
MHSLWRDTSASKAASYGGYNTTRELPMLQAKIELIRRLLAQAEAVEANEEAQGGVYIGGGALIVIIVIILLIMLL